jgi:hypothetical protein
MIVSVRDEMAEPLPREREDLLSPIPLRGRGKGEGTLAQRFRKIALTPALSRERERGNACEVGKFGDSANAV